MLHRAASLVPLLSKTIAYKPQWTCYLLFQCQADTVEATEDTITMIEVNTTPITEGTTETEIGITGNHMNPTNSPHQVCMRSTNMI